MLRVTSRWIGGVLAAAALACLVSPQAVMAQGGRFGQNKVIYQKFDWKVYRAPHFDIYYYPEEEQFLEQIISFAESAYLQLSKALDHEPKFRIPLIYYKNHGDFEQTNVDPGFIPEGTGAFATPLEHRMVLPVDHPPDFLYKLITHELTHIFEFSILFEAAPGRAFRGGAPGWLMEGLASYMAKDERSIDKMVIRDAVVNGLVPPITKVYGSQYLVYRFGHAVFDFIEQEFKSEGIRSFLSEYRKILLSANIEKAIKETFGFDADEFDRRFRRYLLKKYVPILLENNEPEDHGKEIKVKLPSFFLVSPALSPSGDLIAVLSEGEDRDILIVNARDGELIRNLTRGFTNDYDYLISEAFAGKNDLSWSPGGDEVAVFARKGNRRQLLLFNAVTGRRVREDLMEVDEAESPAFSPDGKKVAFAGNKGGQVDIFEYELDTGRLTNITNDAFFDSNPSWSNDGKTILYNRRINAYEKIFLLDYDDPSQKTQVTFGESSEIQPSFSRDGKRIYYSSDGNEHNIFNICSLDLETGEIRQYTDVISGHFSPRELPDEEGKGRLVTSAFWRLSFRLYTVDLDEPVKVISPAERVQEPADIVPFQSALQLEPDASEIRPYDRLSFHVETVPNVAVGVASDGTVLGDAYLVFSDLLGDHRIWVLAQSVGGFTNLDVGYISMKNRLQWFTGLSDYRDYVLVPNSSGRFVREQSDRETQIYAGLRFPFSTHTRVQTRVGVVNRSAFSADLFDSDPDTGAPFVDPNSGEAFAFLIFDSESGTSPYVEASLINDTTRFKSFGPYHGKRTNLTVFAAPVASGDLGTFARYSLDFRAYRKLTSRSLIAWRLRGDLSTGDGAQFFGLGGYNEVRGLRFRELIGDRRAFMNLELRYPLVDELRFPFGSLRQIRGLVFLDAGAAWTQDKFFWDKDLGVFREFEWYDRDESRLVNARASYGMGFSFRMGVFDMNWTFARRLPFVETSTGRQCEDAVLLAGNDPQLLAEAFGLCPPVETKDTGFRSDFYIGYAF